MKRLLSFMFVLCVLLGVVVIPIVSAVDVRMIILDDDGTDFIYNPWSWGAVDDTDLTVYGDESLKLTIPAHSQYQNVYFDFHKDLTDFDYIGIWFKGNNSGTTFRFSLDTTYGSAFYYYFYSDVGIAWEFISLDLFESFSIVGSPDISDINYFTITMSSDNANDITFYIDYTFVVNGVVDPVPEPYTPFIDSTFFIILIFLFVNLYLIADPPRNFGLMNVVVGILTIVVSLTVASGVTGVDDYLFQILYALVSMFGVFTILRGHGVIMK